MISFISFSNTNITKKHPRVKFSRASRDKRGHKRGVEIQYRSFLALPKTFSEFSH